MFGVCLVPRALSARSAAAAAGRALGPAPLVALWCGLAAPGCTWVSPGDLQSKLGQVDDDADGYAAVDDCDDADAAVNPDADEIWYDGVDQDCGQDDDYDADGDGFVSATDVGLQTVGVQSSGNLPGGDCDDAEPDTRPGAADAWYDGIDTDCDGRDDYDSDGDGFVERQYEGLFTFNVEGSTPLPSGDCDDTDDGISPAAVDSWYSGIDEDCSGNNDFDQDGDGQVPDEYLGRTTEYVDGAALPGGDCDDLDPEVFSGATEDYYSARDEDCDPLTVNFDQDGDGVPSDAATGGGPDCDDTDAEVFPGAPEVLDDGLDADCDGGDSTFTMGSVAEWSPILDSLSWAGVGEVRVDASSTAVWFTVAADQAVVQRPLGEESIYDGILAFGVDLTSPEQGVSQVVTVVRNPTDDLRGGGALRRHLSPRHDFAVDGSRLVVAYGQTQDDQRRLRVAGWDLDRRARVAVDDLDDGVSGLGDFDDVRLVVDGAGVSTAIGCDGTSGLTQTLRVSRDGLRAGTALEAVEFSGLFAERCVIDAYTANTVFLHEGDSTGTRRSSWVPGSGWTNPTAGSLFSTIRPSDLSIPRDTTARWMVAADTTATAVVVQSPAGAITIEPEMDGAVAVNAAVVPSTAGSATPELVIGYATEDGSAFMAWGSPSTSWEVHPLPVAFAAHSVAVWVDDADVVYVAVAGEDDVSFGIARR
jgi:hypothetical protein